MGKYWFKIGIRALLIFLCGFALVSAVRRVKATIVSDHDISIPLGAFGAYLPFKLDGTRLGNLRSLTIQRGPERVVTGFVVKAQLSDSQAFDKLRDCHFSLTDVNNIDENTTFFCLKSDSNFQSFGEVRIDLRLPGETRSLILPLMLPPASIAELQHSNSQEGAPSLADSLAEGVKDRVRVQARAYRDSVRAVALDEEAKRIQRKADSLRAKSAPNPAPAVKKP